MGESKKLKVAVVVTARPSYARIKTAIQAIDDIVYEECDAGMMAQIWSIVEGVREVK